MVVAYLEGYATRIYYHWKLYVSHLRMEFTSRSICSIEKRTGYFYYILYTESFCIWYIFIMKFKKKNALLWKPAIFRCTYKLVLSSWRWEPETQTKYIMYLIIRLGWLTVLLRNLECLPKTASVEQSLQISGGRVNIFSFIFLDKLKVITQKLEMILKQGWWIAVGFSYIKWKIKRK